MDWLPGDSLKLMTAAKISSSQHFEANSGFFARVSVPVPYGLTNLKPRDHLDDGKIAAAEQPKSG